MFILEKLLILSGLPKIISGRKIIKLSNKQINWLTFLWAAKFTKQGHLKYPLLLNFFLHFIGRFVAIFGFLAIIGATTPIFIKFLEEYSPLVVRMERCVFWCPYEHGKR